MLGSDLGAVPPDGLLPAPVGDVGFYGVEVCKAFHGGDSHLSAPLPAPGWEA